MILKIKKFKNYIIDTMFEYFKARGNSFTILLLLVFFGLGIYVGFNNRPEIDKVVNILVKETGGVAAGSSCIRTRF